MALWDLASKSPPAVFKPFPRGLGTLALSPDGRRLAAGEQPLVQMGSGVGAIALWDISSRLAPPRLLWSHEVDICPSVFEFSPDGQTLIANAKSFLNGTLVAWDLTGRELAPFPKQSVGYIIDFAFSPDGRQLAASGMQSQINIWDYEHRTVEVTFDGHRGPVTSLAFSPDGKRLISGSVDTTIRVWDIPSRRSAGMFRDPQDREVTSVTFAPDGKSIVSTTTDEVRVWPAEPRPPAAIIETQQAVGWPALSPNGKWLVTVGRTEVNDYSGAESVKLWDLGSPKRKLRLVHNNKQPFAPVFSPDGKFCALGGEDRDRSVGVWETALWDNATEALRPLVCFTNEFEVGSISFSPDGKIMALAGMTFDPEQPSGATNRLAFREVGSWKKLNLLEGAGAGVTERAAAATAAFSNDGRLLAVGYRDGWVRLWDIQQQQLVQAFKEHDGVDHFGVGVSFSNDGRWLASVSVGAAPWVVLFDLTDLKNIRAVLRDKAHPGNSWSATFDRDNRNLVTSGGDGVIKFWNLETLKVALKLEHTLGLGVFLSLSHDGNHLASQDFNGTVKLWSAASAKEILTQNLNDQPPFTTKP